MPETEERYIKSIENWFPPFSKEQNYQKFCSFFREKNGKSHLLPQQLSVIPQPSPRFAVIGQHRFHDGVKCLGVVHLPAVGQLKFKLPLLLQLPQRVFCSRMEMRP